MGEQSFFIGGSSEHCNCIKLQALFARRSRVQNFSFWKKVFICFFLAVSVFIFSFPVHNLSSFAVLLQRCLCTKVIIFRRGMNTSFVFTTLRSTSLLIFPCFRSWAHVEKKLPKCLFSSIVTFCHFCPFPHIFGI